MEKDVRLSITLRDRINAVPRRCWENSWRVVEEILNRAIYVEGIAFTTSPFDHGWVEHEGMIIDVTMPETEITYFPALRFAGLDGLEEAKRIPRESMVDPTYELPILWRFGEERHNSEARDHDFVGWQSIEICRARLEAETYYCHANEKIRRDAIRQSEARLQRAIDNNRSNENKQKLHVR